MPYKSFLVSEFENTAEREIFDKINIILQEKYQNEDELLILIGNLSCAGKEIDSIIIKSDAITVIDFKNYGGHLIFSENGDWLIDNVIVKGGAGNKNPYRQLKENKFALLNTLSVHTNMSNVNLGHITGIVLFHNNIIFDDQTIPPKIKSWFHVVDVHNLLRKINQLTSREIKLSSKDKLYLIDRFNIFDKVYAESNPTKGEENIIEDIHQEMDGIEHLNIEEVEEDTPAYFEDKITDIGFKIVHKLNLPAREAKYMSSENLKSSEYVKKYLSRYGSKLYVHQYKSFDSYKNGDNLSRIMHSKSGNLMKGQ